MTPNDKILKFLEKNDFITLSEAEALGMSKMALSRLVLAGILHKPAKRIYSKKINWLTEPLAQYAPACSLYPDAVICGISALIYYGLTDEFERKIWLAFPREHRVHNRDYRIVSLSGQSYSLGIEKHKIGNRIVKIYDVEKTVVDAFKFLPIDVAHKALRAYLKLKKKNISKLSTYARQLRKPLHETITILLSDE